MGKKHASQYVNFGWLLTSTYSNNFESSFSNLQATLNFLQYSCHRSGHYFLITKQSFDESLL